MHINNQRDFIFHIQGIADFYAIFMSPFGELTLNFFNWHRWQEKKRVVYSRKSPEIHDQETRVAQQRMYFIIFYYDVFLGLCFCHKTT